MGGIASGNGLGGGGGEWLDFTVQIIRGRWFNVFASFMIMVGAGTTYLFGTYSKEIKSHFQYSQTQINTLGFFKDLGNNVGVFAGLLGEVAPPWVLLLVGATLNFISYFRIYQALTGNISRPAFWHMCVYICLAANSSNFGNTAALVTSVKNFPERRGIILGLLKGFVGLSGAVLTQLNLAFYGNKNGASLILLLGWFPSCMCLVFALAIRTIKVEKHQNELRVFYQLLYVSIVLAFFLMSMSLLQIEADFSRVAYAGSATVIAALLTLPFFIAIREEIVIWNSKKHLRGTRNMATTEIPQNPQQKPVSSLQQQQHEYSEEQSYISKISKKPARGDDYTILQALFSKDMGCIIIATLCGTGSTLTAIDNLGQVGESQFYPHNSIRYLLSLVSISNFLGRVFSGFVSESLIVKYRIPRPLMFAVTLLVSCIGQLLIAFPFDKSAYAASMLIGFAFGAQVPLLFAIISELFGLKHYSTLFNCGQLTVPIGSYLLNVEIIGYLYDKEARKMVQKTTDNGLTCLGYHCFGKSFQILAGVALIGSIMALVLAARTREYYRGDIYKKFREELEEQGTTEMEFYCFNDKKKDKKEELGLSFHHYR